MEDDAAVDKETRLQPKVAKVSVIIFFFKVNICVIFGRKWLEFTASKFKKECREELLHPNFCDNLYSLPEDLKVDWLSYLHAENLARIADAVSSFTFNKTSLFVFSSLLLFWAKLFLERIQ